QRVAEDGPQQQFPSSPPVAGASEEERDAEAELYQRARNTELTLRDVERVADRRQHEREDRAVVALEEGRGEQEPEQNAQIAGRMLDGRSAERHPGLLAEGAGE